MVSGMVNSAVKLPSSLVSDAQFGIVAIEADLDVLILGREAGALDGDSRAGRACRWGHGLMPGTTEKEKP